MRLKEDYDGAEPSGNSVAMMNLLRLAQMTDRADLPRFGGARRCGAFASGLTWRRWRCRRCWPRASSAGEPRQIILVGERGAADTRVAGAHVCTGVSCPTGSSCWWTRRRRAQVLAQRFRRSRPMQRRGRTCHAPTFAENYTCQLPVNEPDRVRRVDTIKCITHYHTGGVMERPGATTLKGNPLTLVGPELKAGDDAPDFTLVDNSLKPVTLKDTGKGVRIFSVVPSLDTPVCDAQTKQFNEEAANLPGVDIFTVSMDLPFAQKRWCGAFGVDKVKMLSDHKDGSFGANLRHADQGTAHREPRDFRAGRQQQDPARGVREGSRRPPNYEAALAAARSAGAAAHLGSTGARSITIAGSVSAQRHSESPLHHLKRSPPRRARWYAAGSPSCRHPHRQCPRLRARGADGLPAGHPQPGRFAGGRDGADRYAEFAC